MIELAIQEELFPEGHSLNSETIRGKLQGGAAYPVAQESSVSGKDLTGLRSGHITILRSTEDRLHGLVIWEAVCDCGTHLRLSHMHLNPARVGGPISHCGCMGTHKRGRWYRGTRGIKGRGREIGKAPGRTYQAAVNSLYASYRRRATIRGFSFELSVTEFHDLILRPCYYCGAPPAQVPRSDDLLTYNGVDRMDSTRGYRTDNCVPCCKVCNFAKQTLSSDEFLAHVAKIWKFQEALMLGLTPTGTG